MAGQNNQEWIGSYGRTYRTDGCRIAQLLGQLGISSGLPKGYFSNCQPYPPLKVRTSQTNWQVEDLSLPRKVLFQLLLGFKQERVEEFSRYFMLGKFQFREAFFSNAQLDVS
jgi:hypothetical protein